MTRNSNDRDGRLVDVYERGFKLLARAGYATRAVVYLLVGTFALLLTPESTRGALGKLPDYLGGSILLLVILIGLLCYAMWRFSEGVFDADEHGHSPKGLLVRAGLLVSCIVHLALAVAVVDIVFGLGYFFGSSSGGSGSRSGVNWLMSQPAGGWVVMMSGIVVVGAGVAHLVKAYRKDYDRFLRIPDDKKWWTDPICRTGLFARGIAFGVIGYLLILAGWTVDPDEARGLEGALEWLRTHTYGRFLVGAMGLGLLAFSAYSALQAGFRAIHPP